MFKKRTSKRHVGRTQTNELLEIGVASPRLFFIQSLGILGLLFKSTLVIGLLGLLVWGGSVASDHLFLKNEEFLLEKIDLTTNGTFTEQRIVNETRIKDGATLFALDLDFMKSKLESLPEVVEVSIERKLPNRLEVTLKERVPVAWIDVAHIGLKARDKEKGLLIGSEGFLFPSEGRLDKVAASLPTIQILDGDAYSFRSAEKIQHDEGLRALELAKMHTEVFTDEDWRLIHIKVENFYTLEVTYSDGLVARFGMHDHQRQINDLKDIRDHAVKLGKELSWLDLRPKSSIPGIYREDEGVKVVPGQR